MPRHQGVSHGERTSRLRARFGGPGYRLIEAKNSLGVSDSPFNFDGFRVPFLYATNGEVVWFHDIRHNLNRSRRIKNFHTPQALEELLGRDFEDACEKLRQTA